MLQPLSLCQQLTRQHVHERALPSNANAKAPLKPTQQQVCVEAPLVCLIQQDDAVGPQQEVRLQLAHQHAVCQEAHSTGGANAPVVTDLWAVQNKRGQQRSNAGGSGIKAGLLLGTSPLHNE